jgi:hypothetical protein
MKLDKSILISFLLLVAICSIYRIMPGRPWGFAPQIAMALFSGSVVSNRRFAFVLPLLSMLLSDLLYEFLFMNGLTPIRGFYSGQWLNYLLFASITCIGFAVNSRKPLHWLAGSVASVLFYFFASNFAVWFSGGLALNNLPYERSLAGLTQCYIAGLPFLQVSFYATVFFGAIFFGTYHLLGSGKRISARVTA